MIAVIRRRLSIYGAFAAMVPKLFTAYNIWFWAGTFVQLTKLFLVVYFWRAVYSGTDSINGMDLQQAVNYILWAQMLLTFGTDTAVHDFGFMIREGQIGIELLRPVDLQARMLVQRLTGMLIVLIRNFLPMALVAWLFLGLQFPPDPRVYGATAISLLLGILVIFFFDWCFSSLAFYTTETWGLSVVLQAVSMFFSGAVVPLMILPDWLQAVARALPFSQAVYTPVALFTGIIPLNQAPAIWLEQAIWLAAMFALSRLVFARAVRTVTVQGG